MTSPQFKESTCSCEFCKDACRNRPCWPTPDETQSLVERGYGSRLMLDYWVGDGRDGGNINIVSPAIIGYEGRNSPWWPNGQCTFLDPDGLCELHDLKLKPFEGRISSCKDDSDDNDLHWATAKTWNNLKAQKVVNKWKDEFLK